MHASAGRCIGRAVMTLTGVACIGATINPSLIQAIKQDNVAAVKAALAQKANVNAAEADGSTALHWAAYDGQARMTKLLIEHHANIEARESSRSPARPGAT